MGSVQQENLANKDMNDNKVEDLLLQKEQQHFEDVKKFAEQHLDKFKMELTIEEAMGILIKTKDNVGEDKVVFLKEFGKLLDMGDMMKKKLTRCDSKKMKRVDHFVENGLMKDIRPRMLIWHDTFSCPEDDEVPVTSSESSIPTKLMGSGIQWKLVEEFKKLLQTNPSMVVNQVIGFLKSKEYLSKETLPIVTMVANELGNNKDVVTFFVSFIDQLEAFFKSESGKRIMNIFPQLLEADTETAMELFAQEADYNQEAFFNLIQNNDMANHFIKSVARFLLSSYRMARDALNDNLKFAVLNGMLISNNFPPVDRRNLLKSVTGIIEKGMRFFTTSKTELNLYQEVKVVTDEFEKLYFRAEEIEKLTEVEMESVVSRFLEENLLEPIKDAWVANRHVTMVNEKCAEMVICLFNEKYRSSNNIVQIVTKGLSIITTYSWTSLFETLDYWSIYQAIWNGKGDKKCKEVYVAGFKGCDCFQKEKEKMGMNIAFDHTEL